MNNNNILKEIEPNLLRNGDVCYTSLDICIKQNKIFGILFISGIVPTTNNIIQILNNLQNSFSQNEDYLKIIICLCDEEKNEYDITFSKLSNLSCFIIPFESEVKQKLINKFNIISLPCLIIIDKDSRILRYLNDSEIIKINKYMVKGWKNTFNIKNYRKVEKYNIGDEGYITGHKHILIYVDYLGKSPNYGKGNWYCDICGKTHKYDVTNFYCDICGFDVCDNCYEKNKKIY